MTFKPYATGSAVSLTLELRDTARRELLAIVDYISNDNVDAAQRLKDEIEIKAAKLPSRPRLYRTGRVPGTREIVIRPNYLAVYIENARAVTFLGILHAAQQWPPTELYPREVQH